jgi:hypothetical protein
MSLVLLFIGASFVAALLRLHATYPGFDVAGRLYAYTFLPSPPFAPDGRTELYAQASVSDLDGTMVRAREDEMEITAAVACPPLQRSTLTDR